MRATFFGIEIGRTGLAVSQLGLDVTGHNIANAETRGYTRQRIVSTANDPFATIGRLMPVEQALVGGGVRVQILDQIRSAYLDQRVRTENAEFAYWQTRTNELRYLESFFDNVNEETSINHSIARFFGAVKVLADDPVEGAPRKLLQTAGQDLVDQFNMIYRGIIDLQTSQDKAVRISVDEINRITGAISELNKAIYAFEMTGRVANDLRDKRNVLLDDLSTFIDIEYEEYTDFWGATAFRVSIAGEKLVDHDETWQLGVRPVANSIEGEADVWQVFWNDDPDDPNSISGDALDLEKVRAGEMKAYIDMRDNRGVVRPGIPQTVDMLNELARALVVAINEVHRQGFSDPPIPPSTNGINFFHEDESWFGWSSEDADGNEIFLTQTAPGEWSDADGNVVLRLNDSTGEWEDAAGNAVDPADLGYTWDLDISNITAANIRLSDEVRANEFNIAASTVPIVKQGEPEELQSGNNRNMNRLYSIFEQTGLTIRGITVGSFDSFATSIRTGVGNALNSAKNTADTRQTLVLAAENQRLSVSGVSLDEEMTSLIRYNHAYNGASRVVTAMDDALDRLINGTGRVGL